MERVQIGFQIDLTIFSIILCVILFAFIRKENYKDSYSLKIFMHIIIATAFVCFIEVLSLIFSSMGTTVNGAFLYWTSALFLSLTALPGALWLVYLDYKILRKDGNYKFRSFIYFIPTFLFFFNNFIINTVVAKGFVFTISEANVYSRGDALWIHVIIMYTVLVVAIANFYRKSNMIRGRVTQVVLTAVMVPIIGNVVQMMFYGLTVSMPSYVLAVFMVYLILEKDEMQRDGLTKLYSRSYLENRVLHKLAVKERFSLILIDLNDFKSINDTFGHHVGDEVLLDVSKALEESIGVEDTVCRFGGDEFIIIVEDDKNTGEELISSIDIRISELNQKTDDYLVQLSYGVEYVDYHENYSIYELMKLVDKKMYIDKNKRKRKQITG